MAGEAVSFGATQEFKAREPEKKIYGVTVATVINNIDCNGGARVQLMLPWLPGFQPWARLSNMMAGMGRGSFFVPQIGDEVLVSFNHGDVREPYVLGTLWNTMDRPPALSPTDAVTKRKIRTPLGHELEFDEAQMSVTLVSNSLSKLTLTPDKAELSTPLASVTVGKTGDVTITAKTRISLQAPIVEIKAEMLLTMESQGNAKLNAGGTCVVSGGMVNIN